jgi:predicted methyltransferase
MSRNDLTIEWETENEEGDEVTEHLPAKFVVCGTCEGRGKAMTRSMREHAYTEEEMAEAGPEFLEDYMGGRYDTTCDECEGEKVVKELDEERAERDCPELLARYREFLDDEAEYARIAAAERRMGA